MRVVIFLFCLIAIVSCKEQNQQLNKFGDPTLLQIAEFQDRRYSDSLYQYIKSENPEYRLDAVLAFASIQDTFAIEKLSDVLMNDKEMAIRQAAAFSLGQIQSKRSGLALQRAFAQEKDRAVQAQILESFGKQIDDVGMIKSALVADGLAWALYRAGLRGITDSTVLAKAIDLLKPENRVDIRLGTAHFFSRGAKGFEKYQQTLIRYTLSEPDAEVRMALVFSLRRIKTDSSRQAIQQIVKSDTDYRVRVNAVRALQVFPFGETQASLTAALSDENINVGVTASEVLKTVLTEEAWKEIIPFARDAKNGRIKANLYEASLHAGNSKELAEEIAHEYEKTINPYDKAALLTALQQSVMSFGFVQEQLFKADTPVVRSAAASAIVAMNYHQSFDPSLKQQFSVIYQKAMELNDLAVIGTIAGALGDSTLGYKSVIKDFSFLYRAKQKLSLPKDNEALQPLEAAIAYFEGKKNPPAVKNEFNHPIDWNLVRSIPKDQQVTIKTTKGNIIIQLLVNDAPGSVANFVQLVNQRYFDQKFFHRVVPNFVIQAGCNRGDGWGSEDYSIRSEFTQRKYKTGSVGMASAGKDTEGTQWFITHSPTPHLDGRYTIFAEVIGGMDVVHRMEVGDLILTVELATPATSK